MTVIEMAMHALKHLPGRWVITGASNTTLRLRRLDTAPLDPAAVAIPGMGFRLHADGTARAMLYDGRKARGEPAP